MLICDYWCSLEKDLTEEEKFRAHKLSRKYKYNNSLELIHSLVGLKQNVREEIIKIYDKYIKEVDHSICINIIKFIKLISEVKNDN